MPERRRHDGRRKKTKKKLLDDHQRAMEEEEEDREEEEEEEKDANHRGRRRPVRLKKTATTTTTGGVRGIVRRATGRGENADAIHRDSGRFGTDLDATKRKTAGKLVRERRRRREKRTSNRVHPRGRVVRVHVPAVWFAAEKGYRRRRTASDGTGEE